MQEAIRLMKGVIDGSTEPVQLREVERSVVAFTPDTEEFSTASSSGALWAALCIAYAIDTVLSEGDTSDAVLCGEHGLDTADDDPAFTEQVAHLSAVELMRLREERMYSTLYPLGRELQRQLNLLDELSRT
jgi:hypothetical protein